MNENEKNELNENEQSNEQVNETNKFGETSEMNDTDRAEAYQDTNSENSESNQSNQNTETSFILSSGPSDHQESESFKQEESKETKEKPKKAKKPWSKKRIAASFVAIAIIASLVGGLAGGTMVSHNLNIALDKNKENYDAIKNGSVSQVSINLTDDVYFAVAVAEKSKKSVVGIVTTQTYQDPFFGTRKAQAMGSGVIVDSNGYILTNSHVIGDSNENEITVSLIDGSKETGKVMWFDKSLDLAVVKIDKKGLPAVEIGDSNNIKVGEPVVAIGNPMTLDLERTVTQGIISGLNRSITVEDGTTIKPLIQTDASINSGNSGGPLFNAEGQVIGINTAKMSSAEGLGFAIPINTATPILQQIITGGTVSEVYVGIKGVDIATYEKSLGIDLTAEYGIVVIEAVKDSPAASADIKMGDIIIDIDGVKMESMNDLKRQLYQYKAGDKAKVTVLRNGQEQVIEMTLKEKPKDY